VIDAGNEPPRFLIHDRDSIYGAEFVRRIRSLGIRRLVIPPRAPRASAICERMIGTLRRDCFDHVLVVSERQAERILASTWAIIEAERIGGARDLSNYRHRPAIAPNSHPSITIAHTIGRKLRPQIWRKSLILLECR
jgi:transposase InsO family protein